MSRFLDVHSLTAKFEGGWSDHPADPGGKTMYGITEAVYIAWQKRNGLPVKSIRLIGKSEALAIYRADYWIAAGCQKVAVGPDRMLYDGAVNSGVSRSVKWFKASIGGPDAQTVKRMAAVRLSFMQSLRIWKTFRGGWARRVATMEAKALAEVYDFAVAGKLLSKEKRQEVQSEIDTASKSAKVTKTVAGGGATGGGGAVVAVSGVSDQYAAMALGGLLLVAVAVVIVAVIRSNVHQARVDALKSEFQL